jgi:transcriptional regulator with XRE-family HTH domain
MIREVQLDRAAFDAARRALSMSIAELARLSGISPQWAYLIARGVTPSKCVRSRVARVLNMDPGELWRSPET